MDVTRPIKLMASPFFIACQEGYGDVVDLLMDDVRVDPNVTDNNSVSPFFIACQNERISVVRHLILCERVDVNLVREDGCTPLFYATSHRKHDIMKFIFASGTRVDTQVTWGTANRVALDQAGVNNDSEAVSLITRYWEDPLQTSLSLRFELKATSILPSLSFGRGEFPF